jgi:hypothetical protein
MKPTRRDFLKTTLTASAAATLAAPAAKAATVPSANRDYYELRAYKVKAGGSFDLIEKYLEHAFLPALAGRGIKNVGVFSELAVDPKTKVSSGAKPDTPLWVLIPHPSFDSFVGIAADINADPKVLEAGADYLSVPKATPAFDRIDTWLYLAFKEARHLTLPEFSKNRVPTRFFEMRDYQSHSEKAALSKVAMFNAGEIPLMRDLGMSPVFFGQGIAGPDLPHLRYITSGSDIKAHFAAWSKFGPDPRWNKMKDEPQYKDNTSKNTSRYLVPKAYSGI